MDAIKISNEYDKIMKMINDIRSDLFDCVEIPHLKNYYEVNDQQLCFSSDLYLIREAENYINNNLCSEYSHDISRQVCQYINQLLELQKSFEKLNQAILKQSHFSIENKQLSSIDNESIINTVVVQNAVIQEYFYFKPALVSSC